MKPNFRNKHDIFTLDEVPKGFLQALLPEFTLTKEGEECRGRLLEITLTKELHAIKDGAGKKQFFKVVRKSRHGETQLRKDMEAFENNRRVLSCRFDCSSHPLRYGNGGVLPVIRWSREGKRNQDHVDEYFCLFYRDIFPIGWNLANGASDDLEEMKNPGLILEREFGEELLIRDDQNHIIYTFDPGRDKDPGDSPSKARKAWEKKHRGIASYTTLSVPMTWIKGPDRVRVHWAGSPSDSGDYFLNIVPDDNAIEVDRVALINVKGKINFFDGEQSRGTTLNRAVGLFKVDKFKSSNALSRHQFEPDLVFYDGAPGNPKDLISVVRKKISELAKKSSPFRTKADKRAWEASTRKLDLCPVARLMIGRYLDKIRSAPKAAAPTLIAKARQDPAGCDVFISYRSIDEVVAQGLHDYLESCRIKTFLSALSLPYSGESDYAAAIDRALESAKCLVVLGTKPDSFDSGWVGYEWRSFLNEMRSGRKPNSQLFTLVSGVTVEQLPFALRSYQMIPFSPSSQQDAFEVLARYLKQALGRHDPGLKH